MKCLCFIIGLFLLVPFFCWAQGVDPSQKLSTRIQNEADLLEIYSSELKLNAEQVKHLQELLTKADVSLSEWKNLSEEQQREYLALLADYESMRKKLKNSKLWWIGIGAGCFLAGLVTGLLIN